VAKAIRDKVDFEVDYRIIHPDKKIRDIRGVGHLVLDGSGEVVEHVGTVMDITERKRAEAGLQEARVELERVGRVTIMGELAASIAHEINQPLAGVVTSANAGLNWLAANPPNLSKTREALERILRDGTPRRRGFVPNSNLAQTNSACQNLGGYESDRARRISAHRRRIAST